MKKKTEPEVIKDIGYYDRVYKDAAKILLLNNQNIEYNVSTKDRIELTIALMGVINES